MYAGAVIVRRRCPCCCVVGSLCIGSDCRAMAFFRRILLSTKREPTSERATKTNTRRAMTRSSMVLFCILLSEESSRTVRRALPRETSVDIESIMELYDHENRSS